MNSTTVKHQLTLAIGTLFLAACGGGGGGGTTATAPGTAGPGTPTPPTTPSSLTIIGTAATGAALAGVTVETECSNGTVATAVTTSNGSFNLSVPGGVAPCILGLGSNAGNDELLSLFFGQTRANLTPLSQLAMAYLAGRAGLPGNFTADDFVDNPNYASIVGNQANIDAALAAVRDRLLAQYGIDVGLNFINEEIVTPTTENPQGNQADQRLEALKTAGAIDANGRPALADLNAAAEKGGMDATMNPNPPPTPEPEPETPPPNTGGGTGTGSASACANSALATIGTTTSYTFRTTAGSTTINSTVNSEITQRTLFEGNSALEQVSDSGGVITKSYFDFANNITTLFGSESNITVSGTQTNTKTVFTPPSTVADLTLQAGGSLMRTESSTTTVSGSAAGFPFSNSSSASQTVTVTFLGIEPVSVPLGTFQACRFRKEIVNNSQASTVDEWIATGSGIVLKNMSGNGVTETTAATVNGMPVTP
ncbi:hypothetical protein [Limnobacter parvus]|uniref:Carboxypeptidase regulatory-like domain-containing protein n=1 Tax=Limnobacter parvus TaxID=2939690 RepID=A0ABT1XD72_9BURK|nr:hypothetical protein [Limnobacter parvus]MCR2745227.1 hypothetical protein [Limnobacter parvus]